MQQQTGLCQTLRACQTSLWNSLAPMVPLNRTTGTRVVSLAYYSLIGIHEIDKEKQEQNGAHWRSISRIPELIFDHNKMVDAALEELLHKVKIQPVGFELLLKSLPLVRSGTFMEAVYQRKIDSVTSVKILSMNLLEKLDERKGDIKRVYYYRFNEEKYKAFTKKGFFFNLDVN